MLRTTPFPHLRTYTAMKILHIDSSILGAASVSRQLSAAIVAQLRAGRDDVEVTYRDLAAHPLPHMSGEYFAATMAPENSYPPALEAELAEGVVVLNEFLAADILVIGAGLYNFAVPSQLKAWLDRLVVAGKTFRFTPEGKSEGLVTGKRAILAVSRGVIARRFLRRRFADGLVRAHRKPFALCARLPRRAVRGRHGRWRRHQPRSACHCDPRSQYADRHPRGLTTPMRRG